jgi:hypothetical protein
MSAAYRQFVPVVADATLRMALNLPAPWRDTVYRNRSTPNPIPPYARRWREQMRTIIVLGIASMLVLVAVGSWAMTSGSRAQPQIAAVKIAPVELMMNAKNLPVQGYDAN